MPKVSITDNRIFIASGAAAGASYASMFGRVGITLMGQGIGVGFVPLMVSGAVSGAALQGAACALKGERGAIGLGLAGTLGGAAYYQTLGGIGLAGSFGAFGLGLGGLMASGGIFGLGLYALLGRWNQTSIPEDSQTVFVRMENQIVEREAYAQALLELVMLSPDWQEWEWQQKFRHLEADQELDLIKKQKQFQAKTSFCLPENYASRYYWANAAQTFRTCLQSQAYRSKDLSIPERAVTQAPKLVWEGVDHFHAHQGAIHALSLHPNGQILLTASDDQSISTWDLKTGHRQFTFCGTGAAVLAVEVSPDGSTLVSGGADCKVSRWDWKTHKYQKTFLYLTKPYSHEGCVHDLCYLSTGNALFSSSSDGTIRLWSTTRSTLIRTFNGHSGAVFAIATTPDDRFLVSGSADQTLRIWEITSGQPIRVIPSEQGWVNSVAISPNGRLVASGGFDQSVKLWDLDSGLLVTVLRGHSSPVLAVAFSPDSQTLVSGSRQDEIHVWQITTTSDGQFSATLDQTLALRGECFRFSLDGQTLFSGNAQGVVGVWQLRPSQSPRATAGPALTPWWETLDVDQNAHPKVVKNAYIRLAKEFHPDLNPSQHAQMSMQRINAAYQDYTILIESSSS